MHSVYSAVSNHVEVLTGVPIYTAASSILGALAFSMWRLSGWLPHNAAAQVRTPSRALPLRFLWIQSFSTFELDMSIIDALPCLFPEWWSEFRLQLELCILGAEIGFSVVERRRRDLKGRSLWLIQFQNSIMFWPHGLSFQGRMKSSFFQGW
jgi:hypothetical protein